MYELGEAEAFEGVAVPDGSNLLVSGPPMTGKRELSLQVLTHGSRNGDAALIISTKDDAGRVLDDYADRTSGEALVGVVDCVSRQQGMGGSEDSDLVRYASSPVDLTGIGIEHSELLQELYENRDITQNRTLLHSLSTLLMYSDLQTVFRFLHVITGRIQSADGLGLFVIDETAHDDQTMSTIKQLFEGVVDVREDDGNRQARIRGLDDVETPWRPF